MTKYVEVAFPKDMLIAVCDEPPKDTVDEEFGFTYLGNEGWEIEHKMQSRTHYFMYNSGYFMFTQYREGDDFKGYEGMNSTYADGWDSGSPLCTQVLPTPVTKIMYVPVLAEVSDESCWNTFLSSVDEEDDEEEY